MKLQDVCHFIVDCPHSTAPDEGCGIPLIRTPNIGYGRFNLEGVHRVSEKVYQARCARAIPQNDDIIFAREAPAGNAAIIKNNEKMCLGQRTVLIRPNPEKVCPDFLVYYLLAPEQQYKLLGTANGATVAHVNLPTIREMNVDNLPPIEIQRKIADVLSAYDDLIENNRKQIKLLEEAAQRLYKEWFIDLRFPGYEDTPVVNGLPDGWKKIKLDDIIKHEIGGGWGSDSPTNSEDEAGYVIRGTDINGMTNGEISTIPFRYHTKNNISSRMLMHGDLIFEVSGGSRTEGVGKSLLVTEQLLSRFNAPVICASFCKMIRLNNSDLSYYFSESLKYWREIGRIGEFEKKSASSIINYRWKDFLDQQKVLLPSEKIIKKYNELEMPIYNKIITLSVTIEEVRQIRDRLLPKLMSNELEINHD